MACASLGLSLPEPTAKIRIMTVEAVFTWHHAVNVDETTKECSPHPSYIPISLQHPLYPKMRHLLDPDYSGPHLRSPIHSPIHLLDLRLKGSKTIRCTAVHACEQGGRTDRDTTPKTTK